MTLDTAVGLLVPKTHKWQHAGSKKSRLAEKTLFPNEFAVTIIDEAHVMRTQSTAFIAGLALRKRSETFVAMTATPIMTKPMVSLSQF